MAVRRLLSVARDRQFPDERPGGLIVGQGENSPTLMSQALYSGLGGPTVESTTEAFVLARWGRLMTPAAAGVMLVIGPLPAEGFDIHYLSVGNAAYRDNELSIPDANTSARQVAESCAGWEQGEA